MIVVVPFLDEDEFNEKTDDEEIEVPDLVESDDDFAKPEVDDEPIAPDELEKLETLDPEYPEVAIEELSVAVSGHHVVYSVTTPTEVVVAIETRAGEVEV